MNRFKSPSLLAMAALSLVGCTITYQPHPSDPVDVWFTTKDDCDPSHPHYAEYKANDFCTLVTE